MEFDAVLIPPRRAQSIARGWWQDRTINDALDACVAACPDRIALSALRVEDGSMTRFTYREMAAMADRIVLTKTDLADTVQRARMIGRLHALNPAAPILDAAKGEATADRLLGCGLYNPQLKIPDVRKWLAAEAYADDHSHHHHGVNRHNEHIGAFVLNADEPIPAGTLEMFLEFLRAIHGANLLRLKGIVKLAEMPETPVVLHGVQHVLHPTARLESWPDADRSTRLVFITRDLPERTVRELFEAFLGTAAIDRADRAALTDNPLIPFGSSDR